MRILIAIVTNKILISALIAWVVAQVLKYFLYYAVNKRFQKERLYGDGGMPSGHSATVSAMALSAAFVCGVDSAAFAISLVVAAVVMHDAMGVRLESGKHAKAINQLMELMRPGVPNEKRMKEFLGHTPLQVIVGCAIGVVISLLVCLIDW